MERVLDFLAEDVEGRPLGTKELLAMAPVVVALLRGLG
jgi:hypothetical protein